jgi:hypothetical protein
MKQHLIIMKKNITRQKLRKKGKSAPGEYSSPYLE